jgi:two-component SAPR family response regulator
MSVIKRIIIIDDDPLVNKICGHVIKGTLPEMEVCSFLSPEKGLEFIHNEYETHPMKTILLLDINMPTLNGWEVLEELEGTKEMVEKNLLIYIFSSSVSFHDKALSDQHPLVIDFIEKPLTKQKLAGLMNNKDMFCSQVA